MNPYLSPPFDQIIPWFDKESNAQHHKSKSRPEGGGKEAKLETLTNELTVKTEGFEKAIALLSSLLQPVDLGQKTRIVIEYDPDSINTVIQYFTSKEGEINV